MPYASVSELPASVRDALPAHGQTVFLSAFNSAYKEHDGDEEKSNAIAWSAVKQKYVKNDEGEWVRKAEADNLLQFDNLAEFTGPLDITLQTLETRHPHPNYPDGIYYSTDNFSGTESVWDTGNRVIFIPPGKKVEHVDHAAFANDPQSEAARHGYRIVGRLNNTRILTGEDGKPRINSQVILDDAEAAKFAADRKLSLSDAFDAAINPDGSMSGKVVPNHVILFLKCAKKSDGFCGIPNDRGAGINNLSEETMADDEIKGLTQSVKELIGIHKENPLKATVDNLTAEVQKRDAQIEALTKERDALKADKVRVDNILAEQAKQADDAEWAQVKNLYQPALFHKPEDEQKERDAFKANKAGWLMSHVGNLAPASEKKKAEGLGAVGNVGGDNQRIDMVAERGTYDPINHVFTGRQ